MAVLPQAPAPAPAPGFIFYPVDEEILDSFLKKKLQHLPLPSDMIKEANVYGTHPSNLAAQFAMANKFFQWFFFTWTTPKHPDAKNSTRASRVAGQGRWKSTQIVKLVRNVNGRVIGSKQKFCYMEHTIEKKEEKTMWLMEEYSIQSLRTRDGVAMSKDQKKLDDWVVCKIYLRPRERKEPSGMKVAVMEMTNLERPEMGNQPFLAPIQDSLNFQVADNTLPHLIDAFGQEMVSFRAPRMSHDGILQHPAPQDKDDDFGSHYHEQLAGAPDEGLHYLPQHDMASIPEIPHPLYHEQLADVPNEDHHYAPQHDMASLQEILHPFYEEQLAGAPDESLDCAPIGNKQLDLASLPLPPPDLSLSSIDEILKEFDDAPDEGPIKH